MSASGDTKTAITKLGNLLQRADGCETAEGTPDKNDWIVDCVVQVEIRGLIELLIENLDG